MKDLERKLRRFPLAAPSRDLDDRVLAQKPERPAEPCRERRRVPLWLTAAIALIMAAVGFGAGVTWRSAPPVATRDRRPPVMIQVIYSSPTSRNPFDFTNASQFFPAGKPEVTIEKPATTI